MDEDILIEHKPTVDVELSTEVEEEGQVIVHCSMFNSMNEPMGVRAWKETYLICNQTGAKSQLIKAINIVYQPQWELVFPGKTKRWTMLFERLPKSCTSLTFKEIINQPGAFLVPDIARNRRDVYHIVLDGGITVFNLKREGILYIIYNHEIAFGDLITYLKRWAGLNDMAAALGRGWVICNWRRGERPVQQNYKAGLLYHSIPACQMAKSKRRAGFSPFFKKGRKTLIYDSGKGKYGGGIKFQQVSSLLFSN